MSLARKLRSWVWSYSSVYKRYYPLCDVFVSQKMNISLHKFGLVTSLSFFNDSHRCPSAQLVTSLSQTSSLLKSRRRSVIPHDIIFSFFMFSLSKLKETAHRYAQEKLLPIAAKVDRENAFPNVIISFFRHFRRLFSNMFTLIPIYSHNFAKLDCEM